jgi:FdrA protein
MRYRDFATRMAARSGPVALVSASLAGLQEVICLLARDGVGVSQALGVMGDDGQQTADVDAMLAALRAVQADPIAEIVVLISESLPQEEAARLLDLVRGSDKPSVVCFVGGAPQLAWRAGAIPAQRLDEAAMRAAAWVRGWDQALVSAWLGQERDELAARAARLRLDRAGVRRQVQGLFSHPILLQEAHSVLSAALGEKSRPAALQVVAGATMRAECLHDALADPRVAVVVLGLVVDRSSKSGSVAAALEAARDRDLFSTRSLHDGPLIVVRLSGATCDLPWLAQQEARLKDLGVVVATSNASAALLAGMVAAEAMA